jgi:hypothetical protein
MNKRLPSVAPPLPDLARKCPTCAGPLSADKVCWHCCDRPCRQCGRLTGSAFIDICWPCWFQDEPEQSEEGPSQR